MQELQSNFPDGPIGECDFRRVVVHVVVVVDDFDSGLEGEGGGAALMSIKDDREG